ncbi:MAG: heavy-metal-associated domain-containing protein [Coriobacteriales bacterium]|nr:heavy-metal-associated domain-containing protein [Actinomycetes bacterium]
MASAVTSTFETTGMHCHSCAMLIQMSVGELAGVADVNADPAAGTTTVTYDPDRVSPEQIIDEIVKAGYGARLSK